VEEEPLGQLFEAARIDAGAGDRIQVEASRFTDPAFPPPPDPSMRGRYRSEVPLFVHLFSPNPHRVVAALMEFWPSLARRFGQSLGLLIQRCDPALARRWAPLKPKTLEARRRKGVTTDYPYAGTRDQIAQDWLDNRWGITTSVEQQQGPGGTSTTVVSAGIGPRARVDDRAPSNAMLEAESGVPYGVGPGRTTRKDLQRPLGTTESITRDQQREIVSWATANTAAIAGHDQAAGASSPAPRGPMAATEESPFSGGMPSLSTVLSMASSIAQAEETAPAFQEAEALATLALFADD
jgi:hypothetical protein